MKGKWMVFFIFENLGELYNDYIEAGVRASKATPHRGVQELAKTVI